MHKKLSLSTLDMDLLRGSNRIATGIIAAFFHLETFEKEIAVDKGATIRLTHGSLKTTVIPA